jgi:hypothetical protein
MISKLDCIKMPVGMTYTGYFIRKLKRLGVDIKSRDVDDLIFDHNKQYMRYKQLIKNNQVGGNMIKKIKLKFEGYPFIFFREEDKYDISYTVHIDDDDEKANCLLIRVEKDDKIVYISEISKYPKCSRISLPETKGGTLLLKLALYFIKTYLKAKYNLKYIQLKDNSILYCGKSGKSIHLDSLYMLTHGDTWYGKYGFIPFDIHTEDTDEQKLELYKKNQKLVKTKLKDSNIKKILKTLYASNSPKNKTLDDFFNKHQNMMVKDFLYNMVKVDFIKGCESLSVIYKKIMESLGIISLHGSTYYLPLDD